MLNLYYNLVLIYYLKLTPMKTITEIVDELKAAGVSVTRQAIFIMSKTKNMPFTAKPGLILFDEDTANKIIDYYKIKKGVR